MKNLSQNFCHKFPFILTPESAGKASIVSAVAIESLSGADAGSFVIISLSRAVKLEGATTKPLFGRKCRLFWTVPKGNILIKFLTQNVPFISVLDYPSCAEYFWQPFPGLKLNSDVCFLFYEILLVQISFSQTPHPFPATFWFTNIREHPRVMKIYRFCQINSKAQSKLMWILFRHSKCFPLN